MENIEAINPWKVAPGYFGSGSENIHVFENFIALEDVETVVAFAKQNTEWHNDKRESEYDETGRCIYDAAYWNNRQLPGHLLSKINPEIYEIIDKYIKLIAEKIEDIFDCRVEHRPPCLIRWFEGIEQQPHADKQMPDGSPNPFPTYDINSLFYWNDDFGGGELYYPQHDIIIKPKPGLAVLHPGDIGYMHGVKPITCGERFTTPAFFSVESFNQ